MNFNVYRTELITAAFTFLAKALFNLLLLSFPPDDNLYLKILGETLLDQVLTLVFSLMFIFKNEKVYSFFKHQSLNLLLCQSSSDFYIQSGNMANSNIYAIYNPKLYETQEDYLNFEEIISQHNHNELGSHDDSNVYGFSSVIFVDEKRNLEKILTWQWSPSFIGSWNIKLNAFCFILIIDARHIHNNIIPV